MKPWRSNLLWVVAGLASTCVGWFTARQIPSTQGQQKSLPIRLAEPSAGTTPKPVSGHTPGTEQTQSRSADTLATAARKLLSIKDPLTKREEQLAFVESLRKEELKTAFERLLPDRIMHNLIAQRFAEEDPEGLLSILRTQSLANRFVNDPNNEVSSILFRTWALNDPDKALAQAKELNGRPEFNNAMWSVVSTTLAHDPAKALQMAVGLPITAGYERVAGGELSSQNAEAFLRAWANLPPGQRFAGGIDRLPNVALRILSKSDPLAALVWASEQPDTKRIEYLPSVLSQLAATHPEEAIKAFEKLQPSPEREKAGAALAGHLSLEDPEASLKWISATLASAKLDAAANYAEQLAIKDPEKAIQASSGLNPGPMRDRFLAATLQQWAQTSLSGAAQWVQNLPEGADRRLSLEAISSTWLSQHPESFAEYLNTAPSSEVNERLYSRTASALAGSNPEKAAQWLTNLPTKSRTEAVESMATTLAYQHSDKLTSVISALPHSELRKAALTQGMQAFSWYKSAEGTTWLKKLSPELRAEAAALLPQIPDLNDTLRESWTKALTGNSGEKQ